MNGMIDEVENLLTNKLDFICGSSKDYIVPTGVESGIEIKTMHKKILQDIAKYEIRQVSEDLYNVVGVFKTAKLPIIIRPKISGQDAERLYKELVQRGL
jgi:hypothetical protein